MLLAVVPITAGFPHDRLLFFVGIGGMALLAMLLVRLFDRKVSTEMGRLFGWALIVVHVVIAAPLQLAMSKSISSQEPIYANPPRSLPDDPRLEAQRLVIVNTPNAFYGQYTLIVRRFDSKPAPRSILMLAPGTSSLTLERSSEHALSIEAKDGWLGSPFDNVYRDSIERFPNDYQVRLSDIEIRVVALTEDGRPKRVHFTFERELEDDSLRWVRYEDGRYVPFEPPAVGQTAVIEGVPFSLLSPAEASSESLETDQSVHQCRGAPPPRLGPFIGPSGAGLPPVAQAGSFSISLLETIRSGGPDHRPFTRLGPISETTRAVLTYVVCARSDSGTFRRGSALEEVVIGSHPFRGETHPPKREASAAQS